MIVSGFCLRGGNDEDDDLQATRRVVRRAAVGEFMGRDGQDHDEARAREASDVAKQMEKMHNEDPNEMGVGEMKPKIGTQRRPIPSPASHRALRLPDSGLASP
jgi:hypothetical protein